MIVTMMWESGYQLIEKYTIEKVLGEGGFGITYLAKDDRGQKYAIKSLVSKVRSPQKLAEAKENFLKEAECLSHCIHPSIVRIEEVINTESLCCMVMEYIDGIDLASLVEQRGRLSETEALFYIYQVGEALNRVHQQGFLHRDVKPLNILIRKERSDAVLIDFGFAREFTQDRVEVHPEYGSRGFAPIEQYDLRSLRGAYTDVYGLAATLYALLTAEVPASATRRDRTLVKTQTDPLIPPKDLNPAICDRVNAAILKGLAFAPEHRPQSISAWLELLKSGRSLENSSVASQDISTSDPSSTSDTGLTSAVGIDYSHLRDLLAAGQWQEADRETEALMVRVSGRDREGRLKIQDVNNFPCRDLRILDRLWTEYSNGRFGFSVQRRIWHDREENYESFSDRIGWRSESNWLPYARLTFDANAPEGHLPSWGRRGRLWSFLAAKLKKCSL